ncbi:hypothetical protein CDD83_6347 [Cordyceps sp. RAO-2017]|nr:hypothetical protein CDD83_6347 [Cordyceps sp. RAO-2017]
MPAHPLTAGSGHAPGLTVLRSALANDHRRWKRLNSRCIIGGRGTRPIGEFRADEVEEEGKGDDQDSYPTVLPEEGHGMAPQQLYTVIQDLRGDVTPLQAPLPAASKSGSRRLAEPRVQHRKNQLPEDSGLPSIQPDVASERDSAETRQRRLGRRTAPSSPRPLTSPCPGIRPVDRPSTCAATNARSKRPALYTQRGTRRALKAARPFESLPRPRR